MIGVICDSGTNIPENIINLEYLEVVPLRLTVNNKEYTEYELSEEKAVELMESYQIRTSLPSYNDIKNAFIKLIEKGYKKIITINLSSNLSGTFNIFRNVSMDIKKEYKDITISNVDSLNVSIGAGMLIMKAVELIEKEENYYYIVKTLKVYLKDRIKVLYTIPTLKHLKEGGRIGKVSGTIGELLNIKPIISCDYEGIYYTVGKSRGMKRAVKKMLEYVENKVPFEKIEKIAVYTSGFSQETKDFFDYIVEYFKSKNCNDLLTGKIVPSMLAHAGSGLIGIGIVCSDKFDW